VNEKIDLCIEIAKKRLVDFEINREQSAVHKIFYVRIFMFGIFAKYRQSADFNYESPF